MAIRKKHMLMYIKKRAKARKEAIPLNQNKLEYFMKIGCMKWVNR